MLILHSSGCPNLQQLQRYILRTEKCTSHLKTDTEDVGSSFQVTGIKTTHTPRTVLFKVLIDKWYTVN